MDVITNEHIKNDICYVVITLRGRIAAFHTPALREQFDALLAQGKKFFVLDLTHVEFLDSAGLAVLINLLKRAQQEGGTAKMVLPKSEAAQRILRLTRFDKVFSLVETAEAALQSF